jgi:hypothetical protein
LEIWGVLSGEVNINGLLIQGVQFALLPASLGVYQISAIKESVLLRAFAT